MKKLIEYHIKKYLTSLHEQRQNDWTKEMVADIAKKYNHRYDFQKGDFPAYSIAYRRGWLKDVTSHMTRPSKWTKEMVHDIAKKYNKKTDFQKGDNAAFDAALRYKWMDDVTSHMTPRFIWTKEMVADVAKNYSNLRDFMKNASGAYQAAKKNKWLRDVTQHFEPLGNLVKRAVYVFEFPDKSVYVGLTSDIERRTREHYVKNSGVSKYIREKQLQPNFKIVSAGYIDKNDASKLERMLVDRYISEGWNVLNVAKAGGLGGLSERLWNRDTLKKEIEKYESLMDFRLGSPGAYSAVKKYKLHDLLLPLKRGLTDWTREKLESEALKYKTKTEFRDNNTGAYYKAIRDGILDDITKHMVPGRVYPNYGVECPICNKTENVRKHGFSRGKQQRYLCKNCNSFFVSDKPPNTEENY